MAKIRSNGLDNFKVDTGRFRSLTRESLNEAGKGGDSVKNNMVHPFGSKVGFGYCSCCRRRVPNVMLFGGPFEKRCKKCIGIYR